MPKYLFEVSYSPEGVAGLLSKGGSSRRDALAKTAESVGGTLEAFYFAFGEHDVVSIFELPDAEAAAALAIAANATGKAQTKTTVLLSPEQVDEAARRSVDYSAPGS